MKLTSFLDDGDDGVIGQVRLLMLVLLNKLSVRNLSEQTTLPPINKLSVRRLISRLLMFVFLYMVYTVEMILLEHRTA